MKYTLLLQQSFDNQKFPQLLKDKVSVAKICKCMPLKALMDYFVVTESQPTPLTLCHTQNRYQPSSLIDLQSFGMEILLICRASNLLKLKYRRILHSSKQKKHHSI